MTLPPIDPLKDASGADGEPVVSCRPYAAVRPCTAQQHLTLVLRQTEHAIRAVCDNLNHNRCTATELHELADGLDGVVRGVRGYLDLTTSTGGTQ
ncbi:hypothetical protein BJ970_007222 [Saccharopolyspora phatthalungensis]|uniref:Uncharacterized protein n=1 Tax=Saccharopolyspora phatthalungensis TaxID=664693 RepID=A0A840QKW1_9PSEU|nr:hypothetical protein [Saccharopolyspora phatthalungensis]